MSDAPGPGALRIALLGEAGDVQIWKQILSGRGTQVRLTSLDELGEAPVDLAVVVTSVGEGPQIARALSDQRGTPSYALLAGPEGAPHPQTQLLKALAEAKRQWEGAFDAIVDPVLVLDDHGVVVRANLAFARVLGQPIQQVVFHPFRELVGEAEGADPVEESLRRGQAGTRDARYARLPGIQQVTTSPLHDPEGQRRGLVVALKDVTEFRDQHQRLLLATRLADIGQLAAGVAHEINTPLASIALRAEGLLRSADDPALHAIPSFKNFPRYLKTIEDEIYRCKKIVSALLDFSRSRRPEVRPTDLNALCEQATDLVGHQMQLKRVKLARDLHPGLPTIPADEGQIRQVLIALLMNALDASGEGGTITVATHDGPDGRVRLSVSDNGAGIAPEHLDKIFNPFFTTKPTGQGTGLGLAVCHGVVTAHGGEIRVESHVGKGTRFSVELPVPPRSS
ncbi:MAG TPA: ATP-binding protein [Vicinamibacteria bacterium]